MRIVGHRTRRHNLIRLRVPRAHRARGAISASLSGMIAKGHVLVAKTHRRDCALASPAREIDDCIDRGGAVPCSE